jgi:hypothetical protein
MAQCTRINAVARAFLISTEEGGCVAAIFLQDCWGTARFSGWSCCFSYETPHSPDRSKENADGTWAVPLVVTIGV